MHQISTVQRNLDSGFFISENTQYPAIGPVRACDVINIAGSFLLKIELSKSKGEVYPFSGSAPAHVGRGAFFVFSPLYYRVVVIKAPPQGLCYTVRDAADRCISPYHKMVLERFQPQSLTFC